MFKALWQWLYVLKTGKGKTTNQPKKPALSFSKKNNPLRSMCTLSIVIHWTLQKWGLDELKVCGSPNNRRTTKNPGKKTSGSALYFFLAKTKVSLMPRGLSEKQNMSGTGFLLPPWGWLWLCCTSTMALQREMCGVTSKALLMSFCLQMSDDGSPWQLSLGTEPRRPIMSEGGGTVQVLRLLILILPWPASPELQALSDRPQLSQRYQH